MKIDIKSKSKGLFSNIFFRTYFLILLPVLILLSFLMISAISYNNNFVKLLKETYITRLESVSNETETSLQNVASTVRILSENESFMQGLSARQQLGSVGNYNMQRILSQITETVPHIDSIFLLNRNNHIIYTNVGSFSSAEFLSKNYVYDDYSLSYWYNYDNNNPEMKILTPSSITRGENKKNVIPIVFTKIGNEKTGNLVIVNVDLSLIMSNLTDSEFTDNSNLLIVNPQNRHVFSKSPDFDTNLPDSFFEMLSKNDTSVNFDYEINNERTLVMSYSPGNSNFEYTYVATVPYADMTRNFLKTTYVLIIIGVIVLMIVLAAAYFSTRKIYTPIEDLASLFESGHDTKKSSSYTLQSLHSSIQETLENNRSLSSEMMKALPLIQERYLINLLNSNEHYTPEDDTSENVPIDFIYEYFCSVVIRLKPTEQFYELYNNMEYQAIKAGIHNIVQSVFSDNYETYVIPSEADTLYVLLNLPDDTHNDEIIGILDEFQSALSFDKEYITLKTGIGGIYQNIDGLKKSHHEAINSVSSVIGLTHVRVNADNNETKPQIYTFSMNDENTLLNHLILGKTDEAKELINRVLNENIEKKVSDTAIIQLYVQLLNTVFKVMRMKNISYDIENMGDFHIITEIIKQPASEVHELILGYIDNIKAHMGVTASRVNIQAIITFMQENYREELSLETIADNFNTTPKYLSKLIKEKLGMNFVDYLAGLRIDAAKTLLKNNDMTISDIFSEVGFNNRNTFIRTFKKSTGLTPSEYRKTNKS